MIVTIDRLAAAVVTPAAASLGMNQEKGQGFALFASIRKSVKPCFLGVVPNPVPPMPA